MFFRVCSWCVSFWVSHQKFRATKNRRPESGSAVNEVRGEFFVWACDPHIAWRFRLRKPPWDFSFPGWHPDPPNAATGIPDAFTFILQVDGDSKPQMCHKIQPVWICFSKRWQQGSLESETPHRRKRNTRTCLGMWLFLPNYDETTKIKYISIQLRIRLVLLK